MGRPERPIDPGQGPVSGFAHDLRRLRQAAGSPSYRELARLAHFSATALSAAASGASLPSLAVTLAYVRACGGDVADWEERWTELSRSTSPTVPGAGPAASSRDPVAGSDLPPRQLPADVADFTGRTAELRWLDTLTLSEDPAGNSLKIVVVVGAPGMGKTALAVHWAHGSAERFRDGQLFVSMRGYASAPPLQSLEALAHLLRGLGVEPQRIPVELETAAGLYRTLTARKQILVVLDDAASAAQVRPLLPGGEDCTVIVTGRDQMDGLAARDGARALSLQALTPGDAEALLARIVGADRVEAEAEAAAEMTRLCGHLPLALRIAAAKLTTNPHSTITGQVAELSATTRLAALEVEGDEQAAVRAAFDLSYERLPPDSRAQFRLLGLAPGADVTAPAAAALAGAGPADARRQLQRLAAAHLIESHAAGRYRMHELLRLYAADRVDSDDQPGARSAATHRLAAWYLGMLDAAARLLYPDMLRLPLPGVPAGAAPAGFAGHSEALSWLDAECDNLTAAIQRLAGQELTQYAWLLADGLRGYFHLRWRTTDWLTAARTAHDAALAAGDLAAQAAAQISLGHLSWALRRHHDAIDHYAAAVELARQSGWDACEAAALGNAGGVYNDIGQPREAISRMIAALELDRRAGRQELQINKLANLGYDHRILGRLHEAATHCDEAVRLARQAGYSGSEAHALTNSAQVQHDLGNVKRAHDELTRALRLYRRIGDRAGEADVLGALASVSLDAGDLPGALDQAQEALALARLIGDSRNEIDALMALAATHLRFSHHEQAEGLARTALRISDTEGTLYQKAQAHVCLAAIRRQLGDCQQSRAHARCALVIARQVGYQPIEDQAMNELDLAMPPATGRSTVH